ncbi:hypothetical protein L6164_026417 [Bauhinia variegata]|uniref:Uncharacterized protein n=1 Tax=Bauhinia variegata TaxID=167791 RepID=A0ACB9LQ82_BAUVA|nr:hypothetical protein L6164_026417 [Bauhinia variegata]
MAEDCVGTTVATPSSTPLNWWDVHANSLSSWSNPNTTWNNQPDPNSSSSCEDEISVSTSFTNASNHSSLTVESSRRLVEPSPSSNELMGEHASDNQLWSHVLLGVGGNGELHNNQVDGENFLDALSSKSMSSAMFEPACDYLKKLDTSWEYNHSTSFNNFDEKHLHGFSEAMIENERLTKLSNLVNTWSLATPTQVNSQFEPQINNNISLSSLDHYSQTDPCLIKPALGGSISSAVGEANRNSGIFPCYGLDMKIKQEYHPSEVPGADQFGRSYNSMGYQKGLHSPSEGDNGKIYYGMPSISSYTRNFADVISFNSRLGRPLIGIHGHKSSMKPMNLSKPRKQGPQASSPTRTNGGREQGTAGEAKKKRSEDSSEAILKKPKQDSSTASPTKVQAPKVKLGDKITALQQIVSPFGKTDTASVLFEAIGYIKFLQEQVQLLSNPYLKNNSHKDLWVSLDRKDKGDGKLDLRSRGLCLVPISCTPQIYRENTGPDYWTPAYRGCLYR